MSELPRMGQDIHWVPPRYDIDAESLRRAGSAVVERPAKVIGHEGAALVDFVSFNRTGLYFGQGLPHQASGETEWTWHYPHECEREL